LVYYDHFYVKLFSKDETGYTKISVITKTIFGLMNITQ